MKGMEISRTRLFGIAVFLYGFYMLVSSSLNYFNNGKSTSDLCFAVGGLIMTIGGLFVIVREDEDKMDAIGVYAITYGIFKMLRAYATGGTFWIIPFLLAIPFIVMGIRYIRGTATSVISNIIWSVIYIFVDIVYLIVKHDLINLIDIFIMVMFISVLVSRDVLINTSTGKTIMSKKVEYEGRFDADVDLVKSGIDVIEEGIHKGVGAAASKLSDSIGDRNQKVDEAVEKGKQAKKKKYILNRETNTFEEKK